METLFAELKRYVDWSSDDEAALRALHAHAAPHFARIAESFYDRILAHEGARDALVGGESRVGQLKVTLIGWMDRLLRGPWDEDYFQLRCRIGRVHVRIALPQHYMFGAMNLLRRELNEIIDGEYLTEPEALGRGRAAVGKILDLELAIMLHTYREDLVAQGARAERLVTFGQLVGSIGHELRNPLAVIESSLYLLRQRLGGEPQSDKHFARIGEQVKLANDIIVGLLDMIRDRPLQRRAVRLDALVADAVSGLGGAVELSGLGDLPPVEVDETQLRQLVVNLAQNALYAAGPTGQVWLLGRHFGDFVELVVEDDGPGIDEETRRRLFEPLITTKSHGIGLGLALVKRIVERHGGEVGYAPRPGGGARFWVRLPVEAPGA